VLVICNDPCSSSDLKQFNVLFGTHEVFNVSPDESNDQVEYGLPIDHLC
jgi:TusA-related sulfurtransferase